VRRWLRVLITKTKNTAALAAVLTCLPPSILSMFLALKSAGALLLGIGFTRRWS